MTDGPYRKTAHDLTKTTLTEQPEEREPYRLTAVIQGGTIQVGYTPVAATLAAEIDPTPVVNVPRADEETTPGFNLAEAAPVIEPEHRVLANNQQGSQAQEDAGGPSQVSKDQTGKDATSSSALPGEEEQPVAKQGVHPIVPLGFMLLFSLFSQALFWGEPMVFEYRLAQLVIPLTIQALMMVPFAFWLSRANDHWGPTPWALAGAILINTLATPLINAWLGGPGLGDVFLYQEYGEKLLNTGLIPINPAPEYPPLAVWTFGAIAFLINEVEIFPAMATAMVMAIPSVIMWLLLGRSRHGWMAAFIGLLPWASMWMVIRFDALPTALLVMALLLVRPDRESKVFNVVLAAFIFGLAASAKWYPGLAAIVLFFGYLAVSKWRNAVIMCLGSIVGFALPHFPWVLNPLGRQALLDAYLFHAGRGVTGESLIWQFLYPLGMAGKPQYAWADAPNLNAGPWPMILVGLALGIPVLIAVWKPHMVWVTAAIAPGMWLTANRIFSVQFVFTITVLWLVMLLIYKEVAPIWRIPMLLILALMNVANWMIWPIMDRGWPVFSAVVFAMLVPTTLLIWVVCARKEASVHQAGLHAFTKDIVAMKSANGSDVNAAG